MEFTDSKQMSGSVVARFHSGKPSRGCLPEPALVYFSRQNH